MPPTKKLKVNNVWGQSTPDNLTMMVELPSGQVAKVKRIGMSGLLSTGLLGNLDTLSSLVDEKHVKRVRNKTKGKAAELAEEIDIKSVMGDSRALGRILFLVDRLMPAVVVEPEVKAHMTIDDSRTNPDDDQLPWSEMIADTDREDGVVYTDMIDLEDKMFIFQYVLGASRDVSRFRRELDEAMGDVADGESVPLPAE